MRRFLIFLAGILLTLAALLAPAYLRYRWRSGVVPPWVRLAGMEINGDDRAELETALAHIFAEPVALYYDDQRLILRPQAVGFQVDLSAMLAEAQVYNSPDRLLRYLVEQTLNRPLTYAEVPLRYTLDHNAMDAWLTDVAASHDQSPLAPQPVLATLTIAAGRPGRQLDIPASRERVIAALTDPRIRSATLVVQQTPPPPLTITALHDLLQARLDLFPGIAGLFLHHIPTGDEIAINADVAYAGMSTLKIAIVTELYRHLDAPLDAETGKLISETMALSGNFTANLLLGIIGDGDPNAGVQVLNESLRTLGLKNTFMATPYDRKLAGLPRIMTEANSRGDYNTEPDPYMQTTPREIGLVLQMLVECSQGGGTLLAAYSDQFAPAECQQALDYMALNELKELLPGGIPPGTRFVHKHGYVADTHGDVAAIWGPAGPYILSVFLYRPTWLEWELSNTTMRELSQAVWNYFMLVSGASPQTS